MSTDTGVNDTAQSILPGGNGRDPASETRPFSLADYAYRGTVTGAAVRQRLKIPEGKPGADVFFRTDPRPEMRLDVAILEYRPVQDTSPEVYIVHDHLTGSVPRLRPATIRVCICRPSVIRVWAVKIPGV